ncbi:uncharacterized protein LOC116216363 [Meleagris gallopavo]|uniref:uncharacterized protein LOC116216363 n=1 Tax=Meleagris gallopavo TaxID=9103 RepID=UPI0012AC216C|nr:uncharacterized protein LOC116216363 [Meleagris gallopavo]XP_031408504.1 uncharacterized protein LOC116216363 [Meleagris gallopavo]XP_031408505.1 uncharacterized protein LOC116216363 [Meleagris gallopavo]
MCVGWPSLQSTDSIAGPSPRLADTMVPWACCLLVGLCALLPHAIPQQDPLGDAERCGITFHAPNPCGPPRVPSPLASREELEHLQSLLQQNRATLQDVEAAAVLEEPQPRYQDVINEALPAIRGANQEFGESLDNVRRELEAHMAQSDHPQVVEKREKLRKDIRLVAHVLNLTSHLAHVLDASSQRLQDELSLRLQRSATRAAAAQP